MNSLEFQKKLHSAWNELLSKRKIDKKFEDEKVQVKAYDRYWFTLNKNNLPGVVIDFKNARVMDSSGVEAVDAITKKYEDAGKNLLLRHLSADCKAILKKAGPHCTHNEDDDPTYKVAYNY